MLAHNMALYITLCKIFIVKYISNPTTFPFDPLTNFIQLMAAEGWITY